MRPRIAWTLALALLVGCVEDDIPHDSEQAAEDEALDRMAETYCAVLFGCDPISNCWKEGAPYPSEAECVAGERQALAEVQMAAREHGLTFDPECVEATITGYAEIGCDGLTRMQMRGDWTFDACPPYYGTIPLGENPCFEIVGSNLTDCGKGLLCTESGGECYAGTTDTCRCDEGFACDYYGNGDHDVCMPVLSRGEPCNDFDSPGGVCGVDAYCDVEYVDGSPVSSACRDREPIGSPCEGDECSSYHCDGTCTPDSPWLCEFGPSRWR
jgi:hypothetical protein